MSSSTSSHAQTLHPTDFSYPLVCLDTNTVQKCSDNENNFLVGFKRPSSFRSLAALKILHVITVSGRRNFEV
jgi:hypothetical protein